MENIRVASAAAVGESEESLVAAALLSDLNVFGLARATGGFCRRHPARLAWEAVEATLREPGESGRPISWKRLVQAVFCANTRLFETATGIHRGHGCSIAMVLLDETSVATVHVGGCDVYCFRPSQRPEFRLERLAAAHSMSRVYDLPSTPLNDLILVHVLGAAESVAVEIHNCPRQPGDLLVICTDEVSRAVSTRGLHELLWAHHTADAESVARVIAEAASQALDRNHGVGVVIVR